MRAPIPAGAIKFYGPKNMPQGFPGAKTAFRVDETLVWDTPPNLPDWCHQVPIRPSPPHAPGVRMTAVTTNSLKLQLQIISQAPTGSKGARDVTYLLPPPAVSRRKSPSVSNCRRKCDEPVMDIGDWRCTLSRPENVEMHSKSDPSGSK